MTRKRMRDHTCRLKATGRKENEEKISCKVMGKKKKKNVEIVHPDGNPTQGQLSLCRGITSTPVLEDSVAWEPRWSDSVTGDDDDIDDDNEVGNVPPEGDVVVVKTIGVETSSTASSCFRGPSRRYIAAPSGENGNDRRRRKKKTSRQDMSWFLTSDSEICSGGPVIPDVIPSFGGHVALALWTSPEKDRGVLECFHRPGKVESLRRYQWSVEGSREIVRDTRLSHLAGCMIHHLDVALLSAFVERWQPDTNTFHMPFGEMTILLHDVHHILRIPVEGVMMRDEASADILKADMSGLVRLSVDASVGGEWKSKWFVNGGMHGDGVLVRARELQIEEVEVQCYLFVLLGSTLFVDKSRDRIRPAINLFLKDHRSVAGYAWGAAALAYLYRQLGVATRVDSKSICGCLTLLQAWIYEYFPLFRPSQLVQSADAPRASSWVCPRLSGGDDARQRLLGYRHMLNEMSPDDVTWTPYGRFPGKEVPRSLFTGVIRFSDIAEVYDPGRCRRQFGYRQIVPRPTMVPGEHYRPTSGISYSVFWSKSVDQLWDNLPGHSLHLDFDSFPCELPSEVDEGYIDWYQTRSHPLINHLSFKGKSLCRPVLLDKLCEQIVDRLGPVLKVRDRAHFVEHAAEYYQILTTTHELYDQYIGAQPR